MITENAKSFESLLLGNQEQVLAELRFLRTWCVAGFTSWLPEAISGEHEELDNARSWVDDICSSVRDIQAALHLLPCEFHEGARRVMLSAETLAIFYASCPANRHKAPALLALKDDLLDTLPGREFFR